MDSFGDASVSNRPRVAAISIHPAPYRDPTFETIRNRRRVDIELYTLFETDKGHAYQEVKSIDWRSSLGNSVELLPGRHFHASALGIVRRGAYDAVLIPGYNHLTTLALIAWCRKNSVPIILTLDSVLFTPDTTVDRRVVSGWVSWLVKRCASAWVPGAATMDYLVHYGMSRDRIFQGAYCLDTQELKGWADAGAETRLDVRAELGIREDEFLLLFAGRMVPQRGLDILEEAMEIVWGANGRKVRLLLVGEGPERARIEEWAERQMTDRVTIVDMMPIRQVSAMYSIADAYILPSRSEHYSLALAHAALQPLPIIATDKTGAVYDYLADQESGIVVPAENAGALAAAVLRVAATPDRWRAGAQRQRENALRRSPEWAAGQFEDAVMVAIGLDTPES